MSDGKFFTNKLQKENINTNDHRTNNTMKSTCAWQVLTATHLATVNEWKYCERYQCPKKTHA